MNYRRLIPDLVTSLNILCGCFSICFALKGLFVFAFWSIVAAAVFDFLDGFVARALHSVSPAGKELDSLCDVVSFGVAPGMMVYNYLLNTDMAYEWMSILAFAIPVFSALRLAKFNLDSRQSVNFIGLPVPSNALFISSLVTFLSETPFLNDIFSDGVLLVVIFLFCSWLLVSEIPFFSLKVKHLGWNGNEVRIIFLGCIVIISVCALFIEWLDIYGMFVFAMLLYLVLNFTVDLLKFQEADEDADATNCH